MTRKRMHVCIYTTGNGNAMEKRNFLKVYNNGRHRHFNPGKERQEWRGEERESGRKDFSCSDNHITRCRKGKNGSA